MTRKFWQKLSFAVIKPHNVISMKESPKLQKKRKESFRTILYLKIKPSKESIEGRSPFIDPLPSETTKKKKESFRTILMF